MKERLPPPDITRPTFSRDESSGRALSGHAGGSDSMPAPRHAFVTSGASPETLPSSTEVASNHHLDDVDEEALMPT